MLIQKKPTKIITPYVIAIPTYQRNKLIIDKTLRTLFKNNINPKLITLFLANEKEYNTYNNTINTTTNTNTNTSQDKKFNKFLNSISMVIGKKGLKNQRNFITNFYLDGQFIVEMDDDIEGIKMLQIDSNDKKNRKKWSLVNIPNLDKVIQEAFNMSMELNAYIWGIYPIANAYFMSPRVSSELKFIVGPMFGIINRKDRSLELTIDEKENVQRTLQYFVKDGVVLRLNNITVITKYYTNPGGMQTDKGAKQQRLKDAQKSNFKIK